MMNGRNHPSSKRGLVVAGPTGSADADNSELFGDYEKRLAVELAELLKGGPGTPVTAEGLRLKSERGGGAMPNLALETGPKLADIRSQTRSFTPAARPYTDFAVEAPEDETDPPLPFSWRYEPQSAPQSWTIRQMKSGLLGLGVGLAVVIPAVLVITTGGSPSSKSTQASTAAVTAASMSAMPTAEPKSQPRLTEATVRSVTELPAGRSEVVTRPVQVTEVVPVERQAALAAPPPPAADQSAPSPRPALPADDPAEMLAIGERMIAAGDVAGARTPLARAAATGHAGALLALGETFDPNVLAALGAREVKPDVGTAKQFYARAFSAGSSKAKLRLDALE